jgi:hypothetical protein
MQHQKPHTESVRRLREEIDQSPIKSRRLKLRTLISRFGYEKRSDINTGMITQCLGEAGITLNPPIVRFGDDWEISTEDWIYVSIASSLEIQHPANPTKALGSKWKSDPWFSRIASMSLRTEKEVEIKFIVPLLTRLGYEDDDRFDGMPVPAAHGSKDTTLVIDFALFNSSVEALNHQPLLTVEAKKEDRLKKREELLRAHNQAKSYCLWTQCDYFFVSDSKSIQAFHIARGKLNDLSPLFSCERHELKDRFGDLYQVISKDALTLYYLKKFGVSS